MYSGFPKYKRLFERIAFCVFMEIVLMSSFCTNRRIAKSSFTYSKLRFRYLASHKISSIIYDFVGGVGDKKAEHLLGSISFLFSDFRFPFYIIPPIPPAGIAGIGFSTFFSAKTHSVVRNIEATEAAFSKATRDTFVGSMIPAFSISTYLSSRAL